MCVLSASSSALVRNFIVADIFSSPGIAELAAGDPRYHSGETFCYHSPPVIPHARSFDP